MIFIAAGPRHFTIEGISHAAELGIPLARLDSEKRTCNICKGSSRASIKRRSRGVRADGDDLILSAAALTPPPHIHGRIIRVSVTGDTLMLIFDSGRHLPVLKPPFPAAAYIYHRGGILRFGKLTMNDADLEIVGDRPGWFNFFQGEYQKQLVAGYSKNTRANGLVAHMVDYSRFHSSAATLGIAAPQTDIFREYRLI